MNEILAAFERGIDDGFFRGVENHSFPEWTEEARHAYRRGYDHGIWLYCENQKESYIREGVCDE